MQKLEESQNIFIARKRWLTALAAALWAAFSAGLIVLAYFAATNAQIQAESLAVALCVAISVFAAIGLIECGLCIRNLFYRIAISIDDEGIFDRTGFVHCGLVRWEDIATVESNGALSEFLLEDGIPTVRLALKSPKTTFAGRSALWRAAFAFSQSHSIKLRTMCTYIKKAELVAIIRERLSRNRATEVENGRR